MFNDAKLIVQYADRLLASLSTGISNFLRKQRYEIVTHHNPKTKELSITFWGEFLPITPGITMLAGSIVQSIRSSYDYAISEVVNSAKDTDRRIHFPIHKEIQQLQSSNHLKTLRKQSPALASLIIESIKPTKADNFPIWAVNALANTDKHRNLFLTTNVSGLKIGELRRSDQIVRIENCMIEVSAGDNHPEFILPDIESYSEPEATFEVRFSEPDLATTDAIQGSDIVKTLHNFANVAAETISAMERALSE